MAPGGGLGLGGVCEWVPRGRGVLGWGLDGQLRWVWVWVLDGVRLRAWVCGAEVVIEEATEGVGATISNLRSVLVRVQAWVSGAALVWVWVWVWVWVEVSERVGTMSNPKTPRS